MPRPGNASIIWEESAPSRRPRSPPMTLSHYIEQDLRRRLRAGGPLPCKLTLAGLSGFYRVSPMPVRPALRALVADQFLCRRENGRYAVAGAPPRANGAAGRAGPVEPPRD